MNQTLIILLSSFSILLFVGTAIISWFQPGLRPELVKKAGLTSAFISIILAAICGFLVTQYGLIETATLGINGLGISLRLDSVSMLMSGMISLLGFIIIRFSFNYLDGDQRQGRFLGRLAATIAAVQLLVLSGNLGIMVIAWVLTSVSLHRLLIFYPERPGALVAAKKKFIIARLGDACLIGSVGLLYYHFGSGNLELIFEAIKDSFSNGGFSINLEGAALLVVLAALLKSAQFPTHGWLIEVMETPTPVSALLHAGLLNAGPFLIIRMSFVVEASYYAPLILIVVGGFTALFASVVYLTQTSVKTALGYSSVAHMGFSLLVCGMGVYPAALLHLVAHSFYKAHSFLSTGSVIDQLRASKVIDVKRKGSPVRILLGILIAVIVYAFTSLAWGIDPIKDLPLMAIGAIITLGLARLFTSALDSDGSFSLIVQATLLVLVVAFAFFSLEAGTHYLIQSQVPALLHIDLTKSLLIIALLTTYIVAVFLQILAPTISNLPIYQAWAIHIRNGLYVNAIFDRLIGALRILPTKHKFITSKSRNHKPTDLKSKMAQLDHQTA
jgi:NAD(P)H-quinone oxidoreductase subunit 5